MIRYCGSRDANTLLTAAPSSLRSPPWALVGVSGTGQDASAIMHRVGTSAMTGFLILSAFLLTTGIIPIAAAAVLPQDVPPALANTQRSLADLQLPFTANTGQADPSVGFYVHTFTGTVVVTRQGELHYHLPAKREKQSVHLRESFVGGTVAPMGTEIAGGVSDVAGFRNGNPLEVFKSLNLGEIYPGVRVTLHAFSTKVEKVFTLNAGVGSEGIHLRLEGVRDLRVVEGGCLALVTHEGEIRLGAPAAWQEQAGGRSPVQVAYTVDGATYGFQLGPHNPTRPVVIAPLLQASFLGSNGCHVIHSVLAHPGNGDVDPK